MVMIAILLLVFSVDLSGVHTITGTTPADVQISLAKAAGPAVSEHATIYVLGPKGYSVASIGSNGFTCLVERQRPDTMEPECYDAEGTATTLKVRFFVEEQRAAGLSEERIDAAVADGYKKGRFLAPRRAGIVYMMSDYNFVLDPESKKVIHFPGHLMFYAPNLTEKDVGAGPGVPFMTNPGGPDNVIVVVPAGSHAH
jgi:hypothetical protein